jgi:hypothetical protein
MPRKPGRYKGQIKTKEGFNRPSERIITVFNDEKITRYGLVRLRQQQPQNDVNDNTGKGR